MFDFKVKASVDSAINQWLQQASHEDLLNVLLYKVDISSVRNKVLIEFKATYGKAILKASEEFKKKYCFQQKQCDERALMKDQEEDKQDLELKKVYAKKLTEMLPEVTTLLKDKECLTMCMNNLDLYKRMTQAEKEACDASNLSQLNQLNDKLIDIQRERDAVLQKLEQQSQNFKLLSDKRNKTSAKIKEIDDRRTKRASRRTEITIRQAALEKHDEISCCLSTELYETYSKALANMNSELEQAFKAISQEVSRYATRELFVKAQNSIDQRNRQKWQHAKRGGLVLLISGLVFAGCCPFIPILAGLWAISAAACPLALVIWSAAHYFQSQIDLKVSKRQLQVSMKEKWSYMDLDYFSDLASHELQNDGDSATSKNAMDCAHRTSNVLDIRARFFTQEKPSIAKQSRQIGKGCIGR